MDGSLLLQLVVKWQLDITTLDQVSSLSVLNGILIVVVIVISLIKS